MSERPEFTPQTAREAIAGLVERGMAVPLTDPQRVAEILTEAADSYAQLRAQRDDLAARIEAALQTIQQHKRSRARMGRPPLDVALDVEADLDPRAEDAA